MLLSFLFHFLKVPGGTAVLQSRDPLLSGGLWHLPQGLSSSPVSWPVTPSFQNKFPKSKSLLLWLETFKIVKANFYFQGSFEG